MFHLSAVPIVALVIAGCTLAPERDTTASVPIAVERAVHAHAGAAPIGPIEREGDRYEAAWRDAAGRHEVEVTFDGRVVEREDAVDAARVPAPASAALAAQYADARDVAWTRHELPATGTVFYEATLTADGRRLEVHFAADGQSTVDPEDGEDDGDEDDGDGDDDDGDDD